MSWYSNLFGSRKEEPPPVEVEVERVAKKADSTIDQLRNNRDEKAEMARQLGENVKRLNASGNKAAAMRAYREMQSTQKRVDMLDNKIETLTIVTDNVHDMHSNVAMHGLMQESNVVASRIGQQLDVEKVEDTMDEVDNHCIDNRAVSDALGGGKLRDAVNPEELENDMAAFLNEQSQQDSNHVPLQYQADPVPQTQREAAQRAQLEEEEQVARMLSALPTPGGLTQQQRNLLAQNQHRSGIKK